MAAITRLGLGGSSAAYPGFTSKAETPRHHIGGRLREVRATQADLETVAVRSVDLYDVQGGDD